MYLNFSFTKKDRTRALDILEELRSRGFYYVLGIIFAALFAYRERDILIYRLLRSLDQNPVFGLPEPLQDSSHSLVGQKEIVFLEITEAFYTELYLIVVISLFISLPLFWIQAWCFLAPGLYAKEQLFIGLLGLSSWLLILGFTTFTESFLMPKAWAFFLSFGDLYTEDSEINLHFLPSMALYWKIFLEILLAMTLTSQFPILLFLMVHWGWLSIDFLIKGRPWWILFFLSWAAILSPPDLFSQFLIFCPLLFFYESVVFFILCEKRWETARRVLFK